jgi:hypothetical protein
MKKESNKEIELLYINKFAELDNNNNIIFSHINLIHNELDKIKNSNANNVILISGSGDYPVDHSFLNIIPSNIKFWYCQNLTTSHPKLKPLPIGIESHKHAVKEGHGWGWDHAIEKYEFIKEYKFDVMPTKKITSCFNINTNFAHRSHVSNVISNCEYITKHGNLSFNDFINDILEHECVICPTGNGLDTQRLFETLYVGRIPITFKVCESPLYSEIYAKLPVIILDRAEELLNEEFIDAKIKEVKENIKNNLYDYDLLDFNYWKQQILYNANN